MDFVSDGMDDRVRKQYEALGEYLEQGSSDEWHRVAAAWNWDYPFDALIWIAKQTLCDKATAQMMFHMASPTDMLEHVARGGRSYEDEIRLCRTIAERWNLGFYIRHELASFPEVKKFAPKSSYRKTEQNIGRDKLAWTIDDTMFDELGGRRLDPAESADYDQGFPPAVFNKLKASGLWP